MDNQKVEQVLKEIFDRYGIEIVQNSGKFRSALFDLLDVWNAKEERTVFRHATESDALQILLASADITADTAERAVEQLKKESRMTEEDAQFVIRCVAAACGGNPDIVTENARRRQAEEERKRKEAEWKRREEEQRRREEEWKRQEERRRQEEERRQQEERRRQEEERRQQEERQRQEEGWRKQEAERKRKEEEWKRREEERKHKEEERERQEESNHQEQANQQKPQGDIQNTVIFESACRFKVMREMTVDEKGMVRLYQDKMKLVSKNGSKEVDIQYQEILDCKYNPFFWYVLLIICALAVSFICLSVSFVIGVFITLIMLPSVLGSIISGPDLCITRHDQKKIVLNTKKRKSQQQLMKCISEMKGKSI